MNIRELIDEIVSEVSYRTENGLVDFRNREHLHILSEVLTEMGLGVVKDELIQTLIEADEKPKRVFKNPLLNKVIKYKNVNGEEAEGRIGDLLYRPKEEDAYIKAVGALGGTESDAYKKAMDDLGAQGQPGRDIDAEREKGGGQPEQPQQNVRGADAFSHAPDQQKQKNKDEEVEIEDAVDRKKFGEKTKTQKDAPNGPTQQQILEDLNSGNLDKVIEYQNEVEKNRAAGIAGAGGAVASEGESKYCNACNLDKERWRIDNEKELADIRQGLRNKKRTADEIRMAEALGLDVQSDEFLDALSEADLFCKQKTAEVEADKNSVLYKRGKTGFGDSKPNPKTAYCDWMKAGYFGSIITTYRLKESRIDTSKPHKVVQSTTELNDAILAHLEDEYKKAKTPEDRDYYKKQLELFKQFKPYHDTFAIGKDATGRTAIVSISNKKDSQARDPQNNTTPAQRLRFIKSTFGDDIVDNISKVIDTAVEKVSNSTAETIRSQAKMVIDDDVVRVCEEERMGPYMGDLSEKATNGTHRFSTFIMGKGKDWDSLSTKEKLELTQEYTNSRLYDKNGNARLISESYTNDDGEVVDGTFYMDDDGNKIGPIKTLGDAKIGLPFEPFGKIAIKLGEFGANDEAKRIKKTEKDLVTEVHTEVTNALFDADSADGGYHPNDRPDADNGKNTQAYVFGIMKAMHIDTYIDMGEDVDDAFLIQMGINGVKPSMVRECVAEKSGFTAATTTPEGKKALKEFILKRCRVTPGGEKISVMNGSKEIELFNDQWRTAGTNQKVASYFGNDMRECLQEKAKIKVNK
jgi:hypothetical protein